MYLGEEGVTRKGIRKKSPVREDAYAGGAYIARTRGCMQDDARRRNSNHVTPKDL